MKLFFTRHGKVASNDESLYNGVSEEPLTEEGKQQAENLAQRVANENIQSLISSDSQRAIQTARILQKKLNIELSLESCLKEINFGIFENKSFEYIKTNYRDIYEKRKQDKFKYRIPGGESYEDIYNRVTPLIYKLAEKNENVMIVTHATVIKILLYLLTKQTLQEIEKHVYKNTCLFEFELSLKNQKLSATPIIYNSISHLEGSESFK